MRPWFFPRSPNHFDSVPPNTLQFWPHYVKLRTHKAGLIVFELNRTSVRRYFSDTTKLQNRQTFEFLVSTHVKSDCVCTYLCFNFSKTTGLTNIKLGTIDHHLWVSVIRIFGMHHNVIIKDNLLIYISWQSKTVLCLNKS